MWPRAQHLVLIAIAWLWLVGIALVVGLVLLSGLEGPARESVLAALADGWSVLAIAGLLALAIPVGILGLARVRTRSTLRRLAADTRLMGIAHAAYRMPVDGFAERNELAEAINVLAGRLAEQESATEARIEAAAARAAAERDHLLAVLGGLSAGAFACDAGGRIVLCNAAARALLADGTQSLPCTPAVGRTLDQVLGTDAAAHALTMLSRRRAAGAAPARVALLLAPTPTRSVLVRLTACATGDGPAWVVVSLRDASAEVARAARQARAIAPAMARARDALAGLRLALETAPDAGDALLAAARAECALLCEAMAGLESAAAPDGALPHETCRADELLADAAARIAHKLGAAVTCDAGPAVTAALCVRGDPLLLVRCLAYLASRLRYDFQAARFRLMAAEHDAHLMLTLSWDGTHPDAETRRRFVTEPLRLGGEASALPLAEALRLHAGVVWFQPADEGAPAFRILLPLAAAAEAPAPGLAPPPVVYVGALPDAAAEDGPSLPLAHLRAAAFAVASAPARGLPALASLSALRVVGERIIEGEALDCPIAVPDDDAAAAAAVATLHDFVDGTALVGAGIAASLPPLRAYQARSGAWFGQDALDVLLLARAIDQQAADGTLEGLAARVGADADGLAGTAREARLVARVWQRLLPLLAERGIATLADALAAQARAATDRGRRDAAP